MIPRIAHGQKITAEKLNQVIDALNAVTPASSSLPMHSSSKGSDVSVPKRPRPFYAIIRESAERPRDINGDVEDGEYEWTRVLLGGAGMVIAEGESLGSFYDMEAELLHNPAYEMNDSRKIEVGKIVRMRPDPPVIENDILATDSGGVITDDDGNPIVEEVRRGFLRRYVFAEPVGPPIVVVQTVPPEHINDSGYVTVNHMGVFDGNVVGLDTKQFDEAGGDFRGAEYTPTGVCWMVPLRETPTGSGVSRDDEKLNVLPTFARFKGLYMGQLDFDGDKRPLYSFDDELSVRQFELVGDDDWLQDPVTEFWPLSSPAVFVDQPGGPPFTVYRPVELDGATSSYNIGVGRIGVEGTAAGIGHKGSFGFCRWSRTARRWEVIDGLFKTVALGVADADIDQDDRGQVMLHWKKLTPGTPFDGVVSSTMLVEAFNYTDEFIRDGSRVTMAFDRQENLWFILGVQYPVHVEKTSGPEIAEIGQLEFDDSAPGGADPVGIYFFLSAPPGNFHRVEVSALHEGAGSGGAPLDMNAPGRTLTIVNGMISAIGP